MIEKTCAESVGQVRRMKRNDTRPPFLSPTPSVVRSLPRRPLPVPQKTFRVIFLSTASDMRGRDECRSFGMGESSVVWWYPTPQCSRVDITPPGTRQGVAAGGQTGEGSAGGSENVVKTSCRAEICRELQYHAGVGSRAMAKAEAAVNMMSEGLAR